MSPALHRIYQFGVGISILLAVATMSAGAWAFARGPFSIYDGVPLGNKQLVAYRYEAAKFRVATVTEEEVFLSPDSQNYPALWASYRRWGGRDHWLEVPAVDVSLWWPLGCSFVLPAVALARRVRQTRPRGAGFPVITARQAT
jgi:hypothetical protein